MSVHHLPVRRPARARSLGEVGARSAAGASTTGGGNPGWHRSRRLTLSGSLYVAPGEHIIQARLDTDRVAKQTIQATSGSTYTIELTVPPPPLTGPSAPGSGLGAPPPAPTRPVDSTGNQPSIVPLIVGGSIVVIGAGLGIGYRIAAASKKDELETLKSTNGRDACATEASGVDCSAQRDAVRSVDARRNVSTASFVVAGAALVGTTVYWFWPRSHAERAAKRSNFIVTGAPTAHGGSMFLSGSF